MAREERMSEGEFWADKLMDLANLSAAVLIFGQLVSSKIYWGSIILGVLLYFVFVIISNILRKRGKKL